MPSKMMMVLIIKGRHFQKNSVFIAYRAGVLLAKLKYICISGRRKHKTDTQHIHFNPRVAVNKDVFVGTSRLGKVLVVVLCLS